MTGQGPTLLLQPCDAQGVALGPAQADAMPGAPHWGPYLAWWGPVGKPACQVGGGGFVQAPEHGQVEIGYFCLPACQRRGLGRLIAASLVQRAWLWDARLTIVAQTAEPDGPAMPSASARLLAGLGFMPQAPIKGLQWWHLPPATMQA